VAQVLALTPTQVASRTRILLKAYPKGMRFPKYRLHKPSGRAVIQYRPLFGKQPRYLRGAFGSDESLADYAACLEKIAQHKVSRSTPKPSKKLVGTITVSNFLGRFVAWADGHYGPGRELSHIKRAVRPLLKRYRTKAIRAIGPVKLKRVREDMVALGWSRKHVNAQFNRLRSAFTWGVENELLSPRQLEAIRAVRGLRRGKTTATEHPAKVGVSWEQVAAVLPHVAPVIAAMVEIQFLTAMRSAELTAMRIQDIDFLEHVWVYKPPAHKTAYINKPKVICIGPRAQSLLIPYLQVPVGQFIFSPRVAMREHFQARRATAKAKQYGKRKASRFQPARYRERYFADSYYQAIGHGFDRLDKDRADKVKRWHPHQLRHARATLTRENYGLDGSQAQLGNTVQATEIYAAKSLPLAVKVAVETG
jgi:integrase